MNGRDDDADFFHGKDRVIVRFAERASQAVGVRRPMRVLMKQQGIVVVGRCKLRRRLYQDSVGFRIVAGQRVRSAGDARPEGRDKAVDFQLGLKGSAHNA